MKATAAPATPADQVAQLVEELHAAIAVRMQDDPAIAGILTFIFIRITRLRDGLVRLAALLRAGKWQRIRASRRDTSAANATRVRKPTLWPRNARAVAELLGNGTSEFAERLRTLLADPRVVAFIAGNAALRRYLRPLCRILGVRLIPELRLPRNPRPRPRTPNPAGAHTPTPAPTATSTPSPPPTPMPTPMPAPMPAPMSMGDADLTPWTLGTPAPAPPYTPPSAAAPPAQTMSKAERDARLRERMRVFAR